MARSRLHRRYGKKHKRNPAPPRHNPPLLTDLVEFVAPGFAGFAVSRFVTRAAATQIAKRAPSWGRHAGAAAAVGSFLAAWFLAHKVRFLEKYHTPIVVGSAIAGLQSLIQLYVPMLGWIVSDASAELDGATQSQLAVQQAQAATAHLLPTNEDPNEYTYNDAFDAGRYGHQQAPVSKIGVPASAPASGPDVNDLAIEDAIGQSNLGVFSN